MLKISYAALKLLSFRLGVLSIQHSILQSIIAFAIAHATKIKRDRKYEKVKKIKKFDLT